MKTTCKLVLLSLSIFLVACSSDNEKDAKLPEAKAIVLKSGFNEKLLQDNDFAINLFKTTSQLDNKPNIFISPLSASMALNMTLNGAVGVTKSEMQTALNTGDYTSDQINEYSKSLREALLQVDPSTQLAIANSIWYNTGFNVEASFINVNKQNYNAEVKSIDFSKSDAVDQINNWCSNNTNKRIPTIIDNIPSNAMMYLINAVYFKGIWVQAFEKKNTVSESFYAEGNSTQNIQMMNQKSTLSYSTDDNASYLELPYGNKAFSMIVLLPHEGKKTGDVIKNLNSDSWNSALSKLTPRIVNLHLPRFKFEGDYLLNEGILPQMGMKAAFNSDLADFSGIHKDKSLFISKIIHKTFIEVNEEGSEAAAVTAVEVMETSVGPNQGLDFTVNKPFLFAIREKSTGIILFLGKIGKVIQ